MKKVSVKKLLSIVITFVMVFAIMSPTAFAKVGNAKKAAPVTLINRTIMDINGPNGIIYEETYHYSRDNSVPHTLYVDVPGGSVSVGTVWHYLTYGE